ncbi:MAG: VOC family protein [Candidatus Acetothermia bacterium]
MAGIVFFRTTELLKLREFYENRVGAELWRDQGDCLIFQKGDFRFGFCQTDDEPENCGILTFVYEEKGEVDEIYQRLKDIAIDPPESRVPHYDIYQFFGEDPEGRTIEFQCFLDGPDET